MTPRIFVLAGVNGAGKSSVGGYRIRRRGDEYFNPDEAAATLVNEQGIPLGEANALAWTQGKELLETAIRERLDFAFETTLGGNTIPALLRQAADEGIEVLIWFVGLESVEKHMQRVRARVEAGGHDIPEDKIRERWNGSRRNIINLLPYLTELRVFDNSAERDPDSGENPPPKLLLHWNRGRILAPPVSELEATPEWAKPILAAAIGLVTPRN
ncbi:MAG TPA: AAA family ATPase [Thermoanaerobaculia bacterium]